MRKNERDWTNEESENGRKDTLVIEDADCFTHNICILIKKLKGEQKYMKLDGGKIVAEDELKLIAHNRSRFNSWIVFNILPKGCRILNPMKSSRGFVTVKMFHFQCDTNEFFKRKPQNWKILLSTNNLECSLKTRWNIWFLKKVLKIRKGSWRKIWKYFERFLRTMDFLCIKRYASFIFYLCKIHNAYDKITGFVMKVSLSLSLFFRLESSISKRLNDGDPINAYRGEYMTHDFRQNIKTGTVGCVNYYYSFETYYFFIFNIF